MYPAILTQIGSIKTFYVAAINCSCIHALLLKLMHAHVCVVLCMCVHVHVCERKRVSGCMHVVCLCAHKPSV